jgi:hypothetical protein
MSVGAPAPAAKRQTGVPWKLSTRIMDDTERQLIRIRRVVRMYDVPYVAGYSRDGKTIYIDRLMPTGFTYRGRTISTDRYLILHECVEKSLIDELKLHYLMAHQIAERAEESAVAADGIPDAVYDRFMDKNIALIGKRARYDRVPPDLDLTPYHDSNDTATLDKMNFAKAA